MNFDDVLKRTDLRQIRSFLLDGTDDYAQEAQPYGDTLKNESAPIYKRLESLYPDETELDDAVADLSQALTAYESVYMELGMRAGARLIWKLLSDDPTPPERKATK